VTVDGLRIGEGLPASGDDGGLSVSRLRRFRHWRWRWLAWFALALAVIIAVSGAILLTRANAYRPLTYGLDGSGGLRYPGLPAGHGIRDVNNLGGFRQDHYIPPQRGTFYLFASVMNTGSRAVIIESVTLPRFSHLVLSSPIRYGRPSGPNTSGIGPANRILHNARLGANKQIFIAFPVHSWPCAKTRSSAWSAVPRFYVHYRFMFFHHVAALPWGFDDDEIIMRTPFGRPGQPGVFCAT